ncbi:MAG TPA: BTAD domain-containing putative transcriptional regulator [Actinomycetes bacterium]|nr:BTAD domain-containing putative transcriptional regulator [Actinomycetes bacterium]
MAELRIALLGPPRVERDGVPITVDTRKAIALLAYLAVAPERHARDTMATLLWPDYDQDHARGALRRTLSTLNKALGEGWLAADRAAVGFARTGFWLDVARFEGLLASCRDHGHPPEDACPACVAPLREAARLYRGDFLAGFALRDSAGFDDWQYYQAERLRRALAGALERLVQAEIGQRRWDEAIDAARRWLALDPLHEAAHRQLMRLYAWSGRRAAALRQYQACVKVLDEELGVEPLEETTGLREAILADRLPPPGEPAPAPAAATAPSPAPAPAPLVGRVGEWAALLAAWQAVRRDGRLVVVEGEAGIGKTRLAEDLAGHARERGAAVVAGRCYEEETGVAYGPFIEGLRAALADGDRLSRLPDHWLAEVTRLLPELADARPGLSPPGSLDGPAAQRQFLEGISQALQAACGGPVPGLLLLDDLHAADEASLDVLAYLVHRLQGRPLLVLATWRSERVPTGHRLRRLAADAQRAGRCTVLRLPRLGETDVAELVRALAPARAAVAPLLHRETEGVPFFVVEYLASLPADGQVPGDLPGGVRDLLRTRVEGVGEAARQLLATAAVIGRSFDVDTARAASGRSDEEAVAALEELAASGLVREVGTEVYDFGHGLLRELAYRETSLARRRLLHRRVAKALAGRPRGRPREVPAGSIARHLELGGRLPEAADYHRLAGDQARAVYANREALGHYRAALSLGHPDAAGLQAAVGDTETLLGNYDAALQAYTAAVEAAAPGGLAALRHKLGALHLRRGDWDAGERHLAAAVAALGPEGDPARLANLAADRSLAAHRQGRGDDAAALAGEALALAERAGDPEALARAHGMLGMLGAHRGDLGAARPHLERSLALAEALPDPTARVTALNNLALAYGQAGQVERAIGYLEAALELCSRQGDRHREAALHNNLADLLHADGRHEEAMAHLKQAVAIFAEVGEPGTLEPEIWKLVAW